MSYHSEGIMDANEGSAPGSLNAMLKKDVVTFPIGDKANPRNWPAWRKWLIVAVIIPVDLSVSWGASGFSPAQTKFAKEFGVSAEVGVLGLSMTVLGKPFEDRLSCAHQHIF